MSIQQSPAMGGGDVTVLSWLLGQSLPTYKLRLWTGE